VESKPRVRALMLKVSTTLELDEKLEADNAVVLGEELNVPTGSGKACEPLVWGSKVSCKFREKLIKICADLWGEDKKLFMANEMMACMYVETSGTFSSSVICLVTKNRPNPKKGQSKTMRVYEGYSKEAHKKDKSLVNKSAVGLIQFTSVAAEELKISKQELALMTEIEQLDYVKKYFEIGGRNKKIKNGQEMYLTIFCPAAVHKDKDYVLYSKEKDTKHGKSHYEANKSIDEENNNDKKIQRWEAVSRVLKAKTQGVSRKYINQCKIDISTCTNIVYEGTEDNASGSKAPWMVFAKKEYEANKGIIETDSPLKEKIEEYFNTTNSKGSKHTTPWCGAFVNWSFEQTKEYKNTNVGLNALAFDWGNKETAKKSKHKPDGWINGVETIPFYGAVIVLSYSHVAFIIGENKEGTKYVYLGGNQGSKKTGKQKICYGTVTKGSESCIMKPKNYIIKDEDKKLKKYDVDADGSTSSTR
ncbi:hypothetical protein G1K97_12145, partial [Tenacibaculum finnmarkense]|nr:hypothetical protein [Tenacibaculum finnmarkense]